MANLEEKYEITYEMLFSAAMAVATTLHPEVEGSQLELLAHIEVGKIASRLIRVVERSNSPEAVDAKRAKLLGMMRESARRMEALYELVMPPYSSLTS